MLKNFKLLAETISITMRFCGKLKATPRRLSLTGVSYGTNPTISAAFISSFYGMKDYALNYSISNTKLLFSSFTATAAAALLSGTGTYFAPFVLLFVMAAVSFALVFAIKKP